MDNERKKSPYLTIILWIVLIVFDISAMVALTVWGKLENEVLIASVVLSVFLLALGIFAIRYTYRNQIEPAQKDEKTGKTAAEIREANIHKRRKGKNMFEVCDNYRKQYFITLHGVIGVFAILLPFVFILKFNEYDNVHIPFWWAFIVAAAIMGISIFATRKSDFAFYTSMNLRFEIRKNGFDEFYVNNDFMMATYHDLLKGFLAVGQSYYVVFAQNFCRVAEMKSVVRVELCPREYKLNSQKITRHFVRITENNGSVTTLACADNIAAELILGEFLKAGIATAALPVEKVK
jgi:hypothetical protein